MNCFKVFCPLPFPLLFFLGGGPLGFDLVDRLLSLRPLNASNHCAFTVFLSEAPGQISKRVESWPTSSKAELNCCKSPGGAQEISGGRTEGGALGGSD